MSANSQMPPRFFKKKIANKDNLAEKKQLIRLLKITDTLNSNFWGELGQQNR